MKSKYIIALFICFVLLFCAACGGKTQRTEPTASVENTAPPTEAVSTAPSVTDPTVPPLSATKQKEIYEEYLKECFRNAVEYDYARTYSKYDFVQEEYTYTYSDESKKIRKPPQLTLASQYYDFYDVDRDGQQELIWLDYRNYVSGISAIRDGEVKMVPINEYNDGFSFALGSDLTLMRDGTLRSDVGFGHVPGYQILGMGEDGVYRTQKVITPPCNAAMFTQSEYIDTGEIITEEEFDRRIAELKKNAAPVEFKPRSLMSFGLEHGLSLKWLDKAANTIVPINSPKASPLPEVEDLQTVLDSAVKDRQKRYQWDIERPEKPDSSYDIKAPAKRYYALYDLDGNGAEEVFTGEEIGNGNINLLTCVYLSENGVPQDLWYSNSMELEYPQWFKETRVLSSGWIVQEYVITEGNVSNSFLKYRSIKVDNISLWRYGDEAAIYYYDNGEKRISLTPKAYERQLAEIEKGGKTVKLDWKPLEDYGK